MADGTGIPPSAEFDDGFESGERIMRNPQISVVLYMRMVMPTVRAGLILRDKSDGDDLKTVLTLDVFDVLNGIIGQCENIFKDA